MHPELHEFCRDDLGMTTCLTSLPCVPIISDTNPIREDSTTMIYPRLPTWATPAPPAPLWYGTDPSSRQPAPNTVITLHRHALKHLEHCKTLLETQAILGGIGTLWVELWDQHSEEKGDFSIAKLQKPRNKGVTISPLFDIAPAQIVWTDQSGNKPRAINNPSPPNPKDKIVTKQI